MKILMVGDIVGGPGRMAMARVATRYKAEGRADVVVANAENSAAGRGITSTLAEELFAGGADALTMGDHVWDQKDTPALVAQERRIVRPANLPAGCPGRGWTTVSTQLGEVTVVSLIGRTFMSPADCPFAAVDALLAGPLPRDGIVLCDFHAEATSEKICMGWHLDGRISALFGTHTHVQTSDAKVLPKGTGYITDLGMTGPVESVIGREIEPVMKKFRTGMPSFFTVAAGPAVMEGCLFDIDRATRRTKSAMAVRHAEETK